MSTQQTSCSSGGHRQNFSSAGYSLAEVLDRLQDCCWYWGAMDSFEAMTKLRTTPSGTFLLRDSTDSRHFFTLSVRTAHGITSVRVLFRHGRFTLDSIEPDWQTTPNFDCVLKLIYYYLRVSNQCDGRRVFAHLEDTPEFEETQLVLKKPLFQAVPTLKHLCRRAINSVRHSDEIVHMKLPPALERYLLQYPYPI